MASELINNTMRLRNLPHIWCPGCGNGILMRDVAQAITNLGLDRDKVVIVSGIGCSSRAAGYMNYNTLHTTHGRAIAFATGIKMAKNIDLTVVVFNNNIYGMTGGQFSPTTPTGSLATTAPYGSIDRTFDLPTLAMGAGATYAARGSAYHVPQTIKLIQDGIAHKGFALIDCMAVCPTYYGRKNKKGDAVKMMTWQKENVVMKAKADTMTAEELQGKAVIGCFRNEENVPEYTAEYTKLIERLKA